MDYDLRSIAYVAELVHPLKQHNPAELQRVHGLAFTDPKCGWQNFQVTPGGATFFNPPTSPNFSSFVHFLPDRLHLREQMTGISREEFQDRLHQIAAFAIEHLGIGPFAMQNFVVQSLVNPRHFTDSREFLSRSMLNMEEDDFACLERQPQILGLRMHFPQTNESRGAFTVRVESYAAEPRSVLLENIGSFRSLVTGTNLNELTSNFYSTYSYLDTNVVDFLSQFDAREGPPPEP